MITPLLNGRWIKTGDPESILGKWVEDDSQYVIKCPKELRESIIEMQNYFADMYEQFKAGDEIRKKNDHELFNMRFSDE